MDDGQGYRGAKDRPLRQVAQPGSCRRVLLGSAVPVLIVWLGFAPHCWAQPETAAAAALERAAELEGPAYAVARDVLARQGTAIAPLLREAAGSPDWRRWSLAETLLLRINEPDQAARWRRALTAPSGRAMVDEDGTFVVRVQQGDVERAKETGVRIDGLEVCLGPEAVPVILDVMREVADDARRGSSPEQELFARAASALEHLAEPRTAEAMIHFSTVQWKREAEVVEALAQMGPAALPALHAAAGRGDGDWHDARRAQVAVRALGSIGHRSSAPVLIDMLDRLATPEPIPIYCRAIRHVGPEEGPDVLFAQLLAAGAGWPGRQFPRSSTANTHPRVRAARFSSVYAAIRAEVLAFGPAAKEAVARHRRPDAPLLTRAIAEGVAYELAHRREVTGLYERIGRGTQEAREHFPRPRPAEEESTDLAELGYRLFWSVGRRAESMASEIPAALRIEQAAIWPDAPRLWALADLKDNRMAFEVLEAVLLEEPFRNRQQPVAVVALAEVGGAEAIDVYLRRFQQHQMLDVETIVEAVVLIGDPRGAATLEAIIEREGTSPWFSRAEYRTAAAEARTVVALLDNGPERLPELLGAESPSLRLAAARSLAARDDLRAVPVLFETAVAAVPDPAAESGRLPSDRPAEHRRARDALVSLGRAALPALGDAAARSEALHAPLLAEALALRIEQPELAERFAEAGLLRNPGWAHMLGPGVNDYRITGERVAERLGPEAVPLLEAAVVWQADPIAPGVAAFALARFQQDRSLGVLVAQAPGIGAARGQSLAAAALRDFGEQGIAAARQVPEAVPDRPHFGRRAARHRAAAETLTLAEDEQGIDAVLAGLRLAADGRIDADRTNVYLRLARKTPDPRLVPAAIAAVERHGAAVAGEALEVLAPTADPRILPVCLRFLGAERRPARVAALRGIAGVQGDRTPAYLLEQLDRAETPALRAGIARGLAQLRNATGFPLRQTDISQEALDRHAPPIRRALLGLLDAPDTEVQVAAAESLAQFLDGRKDDEAAAALAGWLHRQPESHYLVLEYVASNRAEVVGPALHAMYREDPLRKGRLARHLATLRYAEALDDVRAALDRRMTEGETRWGIPEIAALLDFGPAGHHALAAAAERHDDLRLRVEALAGLVSRGYEPALEPAARLFDELAENGLWDPRLQSHSDTSRSDIFQSRMRTLAQALLAQDADAAYSRVARASLAPNMPSAVRDDLARQLRGALRNRPELADLDVELPPEPLLPASDGEPAIPLLIAARAWLVAVAQRGSRGPSDEVRDRVMAGGDDSLQIGIELFYPWPTPSREDVVVALAALTSDDPTERRKAEALLAVRAYPASYLDDALAAAEGETFARGLAIRRWRQHGGVILDAVPRLRSPFTWWMLREWPIDELRRFTLARLDRLATIDQEEHVWGAKPLFPLLASLRYSPDPEDRRRLAAFAAEARPAAAGVARFVLTSGVGGFRGLAERWDAAKEPEGR